MDFLRKVIPVVGVTAAYECFIKPRLLSTSIVPHDTKTLMLQLCTRSLVLIPMIVFTGVTVLNWRSSVRAFGRLSLTSNLNDILTLDNSLEGENIYLDDTAANALSDDGFMDDGLIDDMEYALLNLYDRVDWINPQSEAITPYVGNVEQ